MAIQPTVALTFAFIDGVMRFVLNSNTQPFSLQWISVKRFAILNHMKWSFLKFVLLKIFCKTRYSDTKFSNGV